MPSRRCSSDRKRGRTRGRCPRTAWVQVGVPLVGELDMSTAPRARCQLSEALELGQGSVAVDLSALEFIDAAGMRVLWDAHRAAHRQGQALLLVGAAPRIQRLLGILGLGELFDMSTGRPELPGAPGTGAWNGRTSGGRSAKAPAALSDDGLSWTQTA